MISKVFILYGIARPSMQPQAKRLGRISKEVLEGIAVNINVIYRLNIADQLHNSYLRTYCCNHTVDVIKTF